MNNNSIFPKFLRVAIVPKKAIFEIDITQDGRVIGTGGSENEVLKILSDVLDFEYQLVVPSDGGWGYLEDNGTWTGALGMIQDGTADLAIGKISITEERALHFDYSYPYDIEVLTFATRLPKDLERTVAFVWPFSVTLWYAVAVLLLVMPFCFWIILQFKCPLMDLIFRLFESFTRQSVNGRRVSDGRHKLLFASWLLGTMFLSSGYCAVLLSFLTVPLKEKLLENVTELTEAVSAGSYRCMSLKSMTYVLKRSETRALRDFGTLIDKNEWNIDPSVSRVKEALSDGRTAVLAPKFFFSHQMQNQVHISKDTLVSLPRSVWFGKSFCCKRLIDKYVSRISAGGLYQRIQSWQMYQERILYPWRDEERGSIKELTIGEVLGSFYLLLIGLALASVAFVLEKLHFKYFPALTLESLAPVAGFCKTASNI